MKTLSARCDTDKMSCCQRQGGTSQRLTWGLACLNTASCKQLCILPVHCKGIIISAQLAANTCSREKRREEPLQSSSVLQLQAITFFCTPKSVISYYLIHCCYFPLLLLLSCESLVIPTLNILAPVDPKKASLPTPPELSC